MQYTHVYIKQKCILYTIHKYTHICTYTIYTHIYYKLYTYQSVVRPISIVLNVQFDKVILIIYYIYMFLFLTMAIE